MENPPQTEPIQPPSNECPFCHQLYFYEVKRSKLFIYYSCGQCGCKRKKPIRAKDVKNTDKNYFHIFAPYYGAWTEYGWAKNDWGIGLHKERIDSLANTDEMVVVSYGKDANTKYKISAKKVQTFPQRPVAGKNVMLYIVPKSELRKMKDEQTEAKKEDSPPPQQDVGEVHT